MRQSVARVLVAVLLSLSLAGSAWAAPREDGGTKGPGLIDRIIHIVKAIRHILPLEDIKPNFPNP
jgi:hypothetical protein